MIITAISVPKRLELKSLIFGMAAPLLKTRTRHFWRGAAGSLLTFRRLLNATGVSTVASRRYARGARGLHHLTALCGRYFS